MKRVVLVLFIMVSTIVSGQTETIDLEKIQEDLDEILNDIASQYVFLEDKAVDLSCIREKYESQIETLRSRNDVVLFFEYLLDEFYDSHVTLNRNTNHSYRLYSPVYVSLVEDVPVITSVWKSQMEGFQQPILGAKLIAVNGVPVDTAIHNFPTQCHDKSSAIVREWICNKILSGRYDEANEIMVELISGELIDVDLNKIQIRNDEGLLSSDVKDGVGVIRINNTLGNSDLIAEFDEKLDALMSTQGLILDLRNTVGGGNSLVARAIMGRFIEVSKPYQKHSFPEKYGDDEMIERNWVEYVSPRKECYNKPVIVLVGRWTGSMGEGLAIGMEALGAGIIVGTEMERLAGEISGFSFRHQNYGYQLSTAKLYHINGAPREEYVPENYVHQSTLKKDEIFEAGMDKLSTLILPGDTLLKEKLEDIGRRDQTLRLLLPDVVSKFGNESQEYTYIWSLIHHEDSVCLNELTEILDEHGWLGVNRVGESANQYIWLIIQHSDLEVQEFYLPVLKESVSKGESPGWHLAFLEDRILVRNKKEQKYGTQAIWDKELKQNKICPIEDVHTVDQRRAKLGLETMEEYTSRNNYLFDQK